MKCRTWARIAAAVLACGAMGTALAGPALWSMAGVLRDFHCTAPPPNTPVCRSHPDFGFAAAFNVPVAGAVTGRLGLDDKPIFNASARPLGFSGAANFNQWWQNVPGVNVSQVSSVYLVETAAGSRVFDYASDAFYPAGPGNDDFTLEIHSYFIYQPGQAFDFVSADDLWVYIDDRLVVDLGGLHDPMSAHVDLDTLGLTAGQPYSLALFHAQRQIDDESVLHIRLDMAGRSVPEPGTPVLAALALAAALAAALLRSPPR